MTKPIRALIALILAAGLIVAGCGGDDGDGNGSSPATAASDDTSASQEAPGSDGSTEEGGSPDDAEAVVREYMVAAANGDGKTACPLFTDDGLAQLQRGLGELEGGEPPTCEEVFAFIAEFSDGETLEIGGQDVPADELESIPLEVEILDDGSAEVTTEGERQPVTLVQVDGDWRISGLPSG